MTHLRKIAGPTFVALDFETADRRRSSACAVGLVRVEGQSIVQVESWLINPETSRFEFTHLHGISAATVADAPPFHLVWPHVQSMVRGAQFLAAHNASFDRSVLRACCARIGVRSPGTPFLCSVQLARQAWCIDDHRLPTVCAHLGIALDHHDPRSDALACAKIVLAAGPVLLEDSRSGRRFVDFELTRTRVRVT